MAFYPGQQVVCINVGRIPEASNNYPDVLQEGHIYTVRDVVENPKFAFEGYGLWLDGVLLPMCGITGIEEAWHPGRFRPCAKTDISELVALLTEIPADTVDA